MARTGAALTLAVALAACTPSLAIRDQYMGKSLFQSDKVPKPVKRDENGNPILR